MPKTLLRPFLCSTVVAVLLVQSSSQRLTAQTDPEAGLRKYAENPIQSWDDAERIQKQINPKLREFGEKPTASGEEIRGIRQEDREMIERRLNVSKLDLLAHVGGLLGGILLVVVIRLLIGKTAFHEVREKLKRLPENRPDIIFVWAFVGAAGIIAAWATRAKAWISSSTTRKAEAQKTETLRLAAARLVATESGGGSLETEAKKSVWDDWNEDSTPKVLP
jgi:hypothetical protein